MQSFARQVSRESFLSVRRSGFLYFLGVQRARSLHSRVFMALLAISLLYRPIVVRIYLNIGLMNFQIALTLNHLYWNLLCTTSSLIGEKEYLQRIWFKRPRLKPVLTFWREALNLKYQKRYLKPGKQVKEQFCVSCSYVHIERQNGVRLVVKLQTVCISRTTNRYREFHATLYWKSLI